MNQALEILAISKTLSNARPSLASFLFRCINHGPHQINSFMSMPNIGFHVFLLNTSTGTSGRYPIPFLPTKNRTRAKNMPDKSRVPFALYLFRHWPCPKWASGCCARSSSNKYAFAFLVRTVAKKIIRRHFNPNFGLFNWSFCIVHVRCARFGSQTTTFGVVTLLSIWKGILSPTMATLKQDAARMQIMKREQVRTVPRRQGFRQHSTWCEPWFNNWVRFTDSGWCLSIHRDIYIYIYIYTDCPGMFDHTI